MKAINDWAKEINETWWASNEHIQITIAKKLKEFEKEIRKNEQEICFQKLKHLPIKGVGFLDYIERTNALRSATDRED